MEVRYGGIGSGKPWQPRGGVEAMENMSALTMVVAGVLLVNGHGRGATGTPVSTTPVTNQMAGLARHTAVDQGGGSAPDLA